MSGLEAPLLLGVDSLPKSTLLEASNSERGEKKKRSNFILFLKENLKKNHFSSLKCFLTLKILQNPLISGTSQLVFMYL